MKFKAENIWLLPYTIAYTDGDRSSHYVVVDVTKGDATKLIAVESVTASLISNKAFNEYNMGFRASTFFDPNYGEYLSERGLESEEVDLRKLKRLDKVIAKGKFIPREKAVEMFGENLGGFLVHCRDHISWSKSADNFFSNGL